MRTLLALLIACTLVAPALAPALAEEPRGCDKFTLAPATPPTDKLALTPFKDAKLAMPPERAPKDLNSFAGSRVVVALAGGLYQVSLSDNAWVDVVQNGLYVKSGPFSGALDCPGLRKIVRFELKPGPAILQITGAASDSIAVGFIAVTR